MGRWLGIDHGLKRLGVAVSDPSGLLARPLTVIDRRSKAEDFEKLAHIAEEYEVVGIVVGLPLLGDGTEGRQARAARNWAQHLATALDIPVRLWDESFSPFEAEALLHEAGRSRPHADDAAAAVTLQSFLDALRENPDAGEEVRPSKG